MGGLDQSAGGLDQAGGLAQSASGLDQAGGLDQSAGGLDQSGGLARSDSGLAQCGQCPDTSGSSPGSSSGQILSPSTATEDRNVSSSASSQ